MGWFRSLAERRAGSVKRPDGEAVCELVPFPRSLDAPAGVPWILLT